MRDSVTLQQAGCTQILHMLLSNMETQIAVAEQDEILRSAGGSGIKRRVTKQEI